MGSPLSVIKDNLEKLSSYLKMRPVQKPRLLSKLEYLSAKLHLFLEKLKRAKPFWMGLNALSANWSPQFTHCKLKLMACLLQPKMQRRNQRRQWWMQHALPMSLELSRIMQHLWVLPRTLLQTNLESLRLSLHLLSLALGKQLRLSSGLSARAKSSPLPKGRIGKTKTVCLNSLQSSKERSKPTSSR